jgi:hypothetical protein
MSLPKFDPRSFSVFLMVLLMAIIRVVSTICFQHSPMSNFSTMEAMALFGGAYFSQRAKAFLFPLLSLWISDLLLDRFLYYHEWRWFFQGFYWTYGAFALMVLAGSRIIKRVSVKNILIASLATVLIHWIITDLGVWLGGNMYPRTLIGWWSCLLAAIPFEFVLLAATLLYSGLFFGLFEWMQFRYPLLVTKPHHAG